KMDAGAKAYFSAGDELAAAIDADDFDTARAVSSDQARPRRRELMEHIKGLIEVITEDVREQRTAAEVNHARTLVQLGIGLVLAVMVAGALGVLITRLITRPLRLATGVAEAVARGQLDQ